VASAYLVPVAALLRDVPSSQQIAFSAPFDEEHEFTPRAAGDSDVPADAEARVAVRLDSFSGGLSVRGTIGSPWTGLCRRCSIAIDGYLEVNVSERFVDERGPSDDDSYPIEGDFVNLTALVHDAILLDLPIAPLCRPDCQGLCAQCGRDLNEGACGCVAPVDPRWATLDVLRIADDSSSEAPTE
jgi:uncharacterized protein